MRLEGQATRPQLEAAGARPQPETTVSPGGESRGVESTAKFLGGDISADLEILAKPGHQGGDTVLPEAADDPVGRQHRECLTGVDEEHEQVIEGRVLFARPSHPTLVAVAQRRLVPMMAVSDGDGSRREGREERRDRLGGVAVRRHGPQAMTDVVVVGEIDVRPARGRGIQDPSAGTSLIDVQADDRAPVARSSL
jgi:hypothetical protein